MISWGPLVLATRNNLFPCVYFVYLSFHITLFRTNNRFKGTLFRTNNQTKSTLFRTNQHLFILWGSLSLTPCRYGYAEVWRDVSAVQFLLVISEVQTYWARFPTLVVMVVQNVARSTGWKYFCRVCVHSTFPLTVFSPICFYLEKLYTPYTPFHKLLNLNPIRVKGLSSNPYTQPFTNPTRPVSANT